MTISVCVVGAGIIGLSTALQILQNNSDLRPWFNKTIDWIGQLSQENPGLAGIHRIQLLHFFEQNRPEPHWKEWILGFRKVTDLEKSLACRKSTINGWCLSTFCIDTTKYMAWLTTRIQDLGGRFQQRKLTSLNQLSAYDIIVNCSGIGAYSLVPDPSVTPVRGQILRVKAPWLFHSCVFEYGEKLSYVFPRSSSVVLGGTYQVGNWNMNIDKNDSKQILEDCCKLIPSLKNAEIIEEVVGLRPLRPSIRLEIEKRNIDQKDIKIVHNYGHGGGGYSFHWGCAIEAFKLVEQLSSESGLISTL
ncbi:uncharacterized protein TRIADDRAFT_60527 [Trichoplax adhaerens]|uniref:FAD dependent oxidoreductase domain-containing protein n=1 Tax=Trichoplax adhaerens TaxID=10228 RepID=B3S8F9_TRIAD|nr:hypothetical protein TRIADDRAFT_60527 [Trichoplax adhaerens]EDV20880.1 hypothetical protein TRIADDRAFT_60527 [Trichoplax adhaerens]|eukprot:XP_002116524.1 hypothetical protein TRIADDRAFT_60527 [Trichoplax adhaerens]